MISTQHTLSMRVSPRQKSANSAALSGTIQHIIQLAILGVALLVVLQTATTAACTGNSRPGGTRPAIAHSYMVAAANPLAAKAGCAILAKGGTAMDAAVSVQAVLAVVEPQGSGLAGGTILTYWDARKRRVRFFDGLAAAPADVGHALRQPLPSDRGNCRLKGRRLLPLAALMTARAVGVPGTIAVLDKAHRQLGRLPWHTLFDAAITHAENGYPLPRYMHRVLKGKVRRKLRRCRYPDLRRRYCSSRRIPKPIGTRIRNTEIAGVLREIRDKGARAFYDPAGTIAPAIVQRTRTTGCKLSTNDGRPAVLASTMTPKDFASYRPKERAPICKPFDGHIICTAPPPSAGGIIVLSNLAIMTLNRIQELRPGSLAHTHLSIEASRIVQLDRRQHVGDPDFYKVPTAGLLTDAYLEKRASLFSRHRAITWPPIGKPKTTGVPRLLPPTSDEWPIQDMTSHVSIVDRYGNAVALTTTNNTSFGTQMEARGMILNNALVNFTRQGWISPGHEANGMQPAKRPRTSMAPTIVFTKDKKLRLVVGAAGGAAIPDYVTQTIAGVLFHGLDPQRAINQPHYSGQSLTSSKCRGGKGLISTVERRTRIARHVQALRRLGHPCPKAKRMRSGLTAISVTNDGRLLGAADPRRDGIAIGK